MFSDPYLRLIQTYFIIKVTCGDYFKSSDSRVSPYSLARPFGNPYLKPVSPENLSTGIFNVVTMQVQPPPVGEGAGEGEKSVFSKILQVMPGPGADDG